MGGKSEGKGKDGGKEGGKGKGKGKDNRPRYEDIEENPNDENYAPKPDRTEYDNKTKAFQDKIDGLQKQVQQLTEKINQKGGGKDEHMTQKTQLKLQLDEFKSKIDELMKAKEEYNQQSSAQKLNERKAKDDVRKMEKVIGYDNEADIDARIAQIEFRMSTTSISLKDEKDYLKEIADLKKRRPQVSKLNRMKEVANSSGDRSGITENIQTLNAELNAYRDARKKVQDQYTELMSARNAHLGDFTDLIKQREELQRQIKDEIVKRNELREEFKLAGDKHYNYVREIREKRQARQRELWNERQETKKKEDRKRRAEMLDTNPHLAHMTLIEQTIAYCKSLVPDEVVKEEAVKKEQTAPEGCIIQVREEVNMEEFYCFNKKKGKKKESKPEEKKKSGNVIKHNGHTFALFEQLKMDMPITLDDIPQTLTVLNEKLEECEALTKKFEDEKEEMKQKILDGSDDKDAAPAQEASAE